MPRSAKLFGPKGPQLDDAGWPVDPYILQPSDFCHEVWIADANAAFSNHGTTAAYLAARTVNARACLVGWACMTFGFRPDFAGRDSRPHRTLVPLLTFLWALLEPHEQDRFLRVTKRPWIDARLTWQKYLELATSQDGVYIPRDLFCFVSDVFEAPMAPKDAARRWKRALRACDYAVPGR